MKDIIVLADAFKHQFTGGAELHDDVVIQYFKSNNRLYEKRNCHLLDDDYIRRNIDKKWFISNFTGLKVSHMAMIAKHCKYFIYEHDYKFIDVRNPIFFKDFIVPEVHKVNLNFYSLAQKVICLSAMQREIFERNLNLNNIENFQCSMWSDEEMKIIESLMGNEKKQRFAVIDSNNKIKKTYESVMFCKKNNIKYDLIKSENYIEFLKILSKYSGLVFMTGHPEPTPRVAIEAKMLNMKFISQKNLIGVAKEDYFHLTGKEMIDHVRSMRDENLKKVIEWIDEV